MARKLTAITAELLDKIKEVYHEGGQDIEVCKALDIPITEFERLYQENTMIREFADAGRLYSRAWWYEQGRKNIHNTKFNTALWMFHMKNLHGWTDKAETTQVNVQGMETMEQAQSTMKALIPDVLKICGIDDAEAAQILRRLNNV
jgi:hypothetical protein